MRHPEINISFQDKWQFLLPYDKVVQRFLPPQAGSSENDHSCYKFSEYLNLLMVRRLQCTVTNSKTYSLANTLLSELFWCLSSHDLPEVQKAMNAQAKSLRYGLAKVFLSLFFPSCISSNSKI